MRRILAIVAISIIAFSGCGKEKRAENEIRAYPMDTLEGLITRDGIEIDPSVKVTGTSSLKISVHDSVTVRLYDTGDIDAENTRLIYRARVRTSGLQGKVYLEMWLRFPGKGEFFSRGSERALAGTNEWTSLEIPFLLGPGENPENVQLCLAITGPGTVWIDDVKLLKQI